MSVIMTRSTLGPEFLKGLTADLLEVNDQTKDDLALAAEGSMAVENLKSSSIFRTMDSVNAQETIDGISSLGDLELTQEGEDYKADSFIETYKTVFKPEFYTKAVTLTKLSIDDGKIQPALDRTKKLLVAAKRTINKHTFDIFNKAFTAPASLPKHLTYYGDGVALSSTLHPIKGTGGTQSNASTTSIPLTETNLEVGILALQGQLGDKNGELLSVGDGQITLVVPTTLRKLALEITESVLRSNTANNDMNIYDGNITVMTSKRFNANSDGSDTAWFLVDSSMSPLIYLNRQGIEMSAPYLTDSNKNVTWDVSTRYKVGNDDFRGFWGSKGDNTSYTA